MSTEGPKRKRRRVNQGKDEEPKKSEIPKAPVVESGSESESDVSDEGSVAAHISLDARPLKELAEKTKKSLAGADAMSEGKKGVVYLGHIPHGFYEEQMKAFFSQFGEVCRLRLSRSKRTGGSKHYAFIEFESAEVAQIVADAMDKYLLYDRILVCHVIPSEKVHAGMFSGSGRKFRKVPWQRLAKDKHNAPKNKEQRDTLVEKLLSREEEKRLRLKELGIEYDFPGVKSERAKELSGP